MDAAAVGESSSRTDGDSSATGPGVIAAQRSGSRWRTKAAYGWRQQRCGAARANPAQEVRGRVIYQAGPLFSEAERAFHRALAARLREAGHTVVWPGDLLTQAQIEAAGEQAPRLICTACREALDGCDCVVALLDGPQVDDGTAWEIGYACARGVPVYGLRTDFRRAGETPHSRINSMIEGTLAGLARSVEELAGMLA